MEQVEGCYGCRMLARRAADAQATIAALQARVQELEQPVYVCQGCGRLGRDGWLPTSFTSDELRGSVQCPDCGCIDREKNTARELAAICTKAQSELTQRTAELEAANQRVMDERNLSNSWMKKHDELLAKVHKSGQFGAVVVQDVLKERDTLQAELERVRDQFADLRKMVAALPKVEGAVVVSHGYVKDSTRCHALFGADEDAALYAALLQHRQGMEG